MNRQFAHLHLHTQYSLLDGANRLTDVIERAYKLGQPAIAMTDHGNLHGAVEFYSEAKKVGIKPIIGCELYITPGSRHDRKPKIHGGSETHHITVLASNPVGYQNLCRLSTLAYKEGFYFKPRIDHELLERYNEGLIVLSGCLNSELNSYIERDDIKGAEKLVEFYVKTLGNRFYLEVQPHPIPEQRKLNLGCAELAKRVGIPIVATTDCHYLTADDHYAQEVLMCVSTGKQVTDPDRIKHEGVSLYLKSGDEMLTEFGDVSYADEAVANSLEIAKRCELSLDFSTYHLPKYADGKSETMNRLMAESARDGLRERISKLRELYKEWDDELEKEYWSRLEREILLIDKMGFSGYFLVVSDFIVWAKENDVPVGPGRGSGAGSLVAYAMKITDIDPIKHKLLFERFLNPERVSLPDFDVDFCMLGRDRVISYVVEKYGKDMVAQIATFGTLKAKAAIKDVGRALGISYAETDKIAQLVPAPRQGFDFSLTQAIEMEPRLKEYADGEGKELITLAMKLEGLCRHCSTHAAGVVIGDQPLIDLVPLMVDKDGKDVTQYSMKYCEKIGLVKFDFLGLKTLTVIHTALRIIAESQGVDISLADLPLDDPSTYQLLCEGNTTGVFQLESGGITEMTMRLKPSCFNDLVAILALYRPGPLDAGMVDHYIARKHGKQQVVYLHPNMQGILADTYGIMIYQEQIMQLAQVLAGYSLGEADLLRRAMGKKNPEEMAKQRDRFISGCSKNGIVNKLSEEIFDQMETFARYGFNRSHSAAYAMISFQTAYLKRYYPVEFMAALMSHEMDDSDKTLKNLNECRKHHIDVLPPDVNVSGAGFTVREGKVRFGLEAVKGIGEKAVLAIIEGRKEGGPYADMEDLLSRVDLKALNRRVLESLIKCGAMDCGKVTRCEMMERIDDALKAAQTAQRDRDSNQISLFGGPQQVQIVPKKSTNRPEWPTNQKLAFEREALGFYISGHPLEKFKNEYKRLGIAPLLDVRAKTQSGEVRVAGVVTALKLKNTKKGDRYASFILEDYSATIETLAWPDTYRENSVLLGSDEPVVISGKLDVSEERCTLIVNEIKSLNEIRGKQANVGVLTLNGQDPFAKQMKSLSELFKRYPGRCPIRVKIEVDGSEISMVLKDQGNSPITVAPSEVLCDQVEQIFGRPVLSFV